MAQNPMQDIVPQGTRSIKRIPLGETRTKTIHHREEIVEKLERKPEKTLRSFPVEKPRHRIVEEVRVDDEDSESTIDSVRHEFESSRKKTSHRKNIKQHWKKISILGGTVVVVALVIAISHIFQSATLTLTPRNLSQNIQQDYTAQKSASVIPGELTYQVLTLKITGSETVKANGEKQVDKRATGTIVIYNNYNSVAQRLVKNTRFITPEGLIFRTTENVTVPGKKGSTPGSVEAVVSADETGDSYNVGLKDFTIPGFKGDPRYTSFYARSKTPLAGGFSGIQKVVAETDRAKAKNTIEIRVTEALLKEAWSGMTPEAAYFTNGYTIDFKMLPEESNGSDVTIKEEGVLSMVVFDRKILGSAVAKAELGKSYDGLPVFIKNVDTLTFKPKGDFKPGVSDIVSFTLSGNASFEWYYDELALKQTLMGKKRSDIQTLLQKYPTVEKADISMRPFWSRSFPNSLEKIIVKKGV